MDRDPTIGKLSACVTKISSRKFLNSREETSVRYAIFLYYESEQLYERGESKAKKRKRNYQIFLKQLSDFQLIAVCAVSLGQTVIGDMGDGLRVPLPLKIKEFKEDLQCDVLLKAANRYRIEAEQMQLATVLPINDGSLDSEALLLMSQSETGSGESFLPQGELFPLSREDVIQMVRSAHFKGAYHLSEPFDTVLDPVVQISVSHEWSHWIRSQHRAVHS